LPPLSCEVKKNILVAFEVLTAVVMKSTVLDCNPMQFGENPMFRRNISPFSGLKSNPSKKPAEAGRKLN
jgi:hypothetical protein